MRISSPKLNIMYKACMKASKSLIRDFGEVENLQVSVKGPTDFVSNADINAEKIIIDELSKLKNLSGQALHAKTLKFVHPTTKKELNFNSDLPKEFKKMLNLLENLSS